MAISVSRRLWELAENQRLAYKSLYDWFVFSIGNGSLPIQSFRLFVEQDFAFLIAFEKSILSCGKLALNSIDTQQFAVRFEYLASRINDEVASLREAAAFDNSDHEEYFPENFMLHSTRECIAFLDSLSNNHEGHSLGVICAGLLPCPRLYAFIGRCLSESADQSIEHPRALQHWIQLYSGSSEKDKQNELEKILDACFVESDWDLVKTNFNRAMELEFCFFKCQPRVEKLSRPVGIWKPSELLFVTDFDQTVTVDDTTALLVQMSIEESNQKDKQAKLIEWRRLEEQYFSNYNEFLQKHGLHEDVVVSDNFDETGLRRFCEEMAYFEKESVRPVEKSKILAGISKQLIVQKAQNLTKTVRSGFAECFRYVLENTQTEQVHVLSVNWSKDLVSSTIISALSEIEVKCNEDQFKVFSSDLEFSPSGGLSSGRIFSRMSHVLHKQNKFSQLKVSHPDSVTVYVGDNVNDILPLLDADYGLLFDRGSSTMLRMCEKFGIVRRPLLSSLLSPFKDLDKKVIWTLTSWFEVLEWLRFQSPRFILNSPPVPSLLIAAGSDSGGGAGIQADVKTCEALGVFSCTAITALTAQNAEGVKDVHITPVANFTKQISAVLSDISPRVIKTGMLPSSEIVNSLLAAVKIGSFSNIVVDPVIVTSSGHILIDEVTLESIKNNLFPLTDVITLNHHEARQLLKTSTPISSLPDMITSAKLLRETFSSKWVLLKGGHLLDVNKAVKSIPDILYGADDMRDPPQLFIFLSSAV